MHLLKTERKCKAALIMNALRRAKEERDSWFNLEREWEKGQRRKVKHNSVCPVGRQRHKFLSCVYVWKVWSCCCRLWGFSPAPKARPLYTHVKKIASTILDFSTSFLPTRAVLLWSRSQSIEQQNLELPHPERSPNSFSGGWWPSFMASLPVLGTTLGKMLYVQNLLRYISINTGSYHQLQFPILPVPCTLFCMQTACSISPNYVCFQRQTNQRRKNKNKVSCPGQHNVCVFWITFCNSNSFWRQKYPRNGLWCTQQHLIQWPQTSWCLCCRIRGH